ncbi:uncharacterized protein LOC120273991 [Dioscorea cayenensis subsp. rotundata]|uniref:Uncharacterized protein LOC120273991 n=1 Tax=Dioscorea cayennensis subsp. rotundata TaxID=55577 RepID=A0AB40CA38_DIOCR|nr:uncharacterized protein LOC120273991 [Dioscorea cayenensis subsp. rotundata]
MNTISTLRSSLRAANSHRTCLQPLARALSTTPSGTDDLTKKTQTEAEKKPKGNNTSTPPNLKTSELPPPLDPSLQQRRRCHVSKEALDGVSCVGFDGGIITGGDWKEDFKEYYEDHKPSPLAEIEIVDTRKPITKAIDERWEEGVVGAAMVEEDTVDAALERAERLFREAAERGDPETPHSKALARMIAMRERNHSDAFCRLI